MMRTTHVQVRAVSNESFRKFGLLVAGVIICITLTFWLTRVSFRREMASGKTRGDNGTIAELDRLKRSVRVLEQKSSALQVAITAQSLLTQNEPVEVGRAKDLEPDSSNSQRAAQPEPLSGEEEHERVLKEFDVVLETDTGDLRERILAAESLRGELVTATGNGTLVRRVDCATAFCRAIIEEDTAGGPELDTGVIIDKTPSLWKGESRFGYVRDGITKRTLIYVARAGQRLPVPGEQ